MIAVMVAVLLIIIIITIIIVVIVLRISITITAIVTATGTTITVTWWSPPAAPSSYSQYEQGVFKMAVNIGATLILHGYTSIGPPQ